MDDDELALPSQNQTPTKPGHFCALFNCVEGLSVKLKGKKSIKIPYTKEEMCRVKGCLKWIDQDNSGLPRLRGRKRKREQGNGRPAHKAKDSVKYVFTDATSEEEPNADASDKSSPSGYRLAAHHYMVAKKQRLIQGPRTRTCALKIEKAKQFSSTDTEATMDYDPDSATPSRKRKPRKRKTVQGQLVTRSFFLRKDGKGTQPATKPKLKCKKKHTFKCIKCNTYCSSVRVLNQHFKDNHRPLQCSKCQKFFMTQGAYKLHSYKHKDGQFECTECKMTFPFKSQLKQHKPSHVMDRPYHCTEKGCKHRFSHEHDLKKHLKAHDGEKHYCTL